MIEADDLYLSLLEMIKEKGLDYEINETGDIVFSFSMSLCYASPFSKEVIALLECLNMKDRGEPTEAETQRMMTDYIFRKIMKRL